MFAPTKWYWNKKTNTSTQHSTDVNTWLGFSKGSRQKCTTNSANDNDTITSNLKVTQTKTATFSQWSHIPKDTVKVLGTYVRRWEYRSISRVLIQSKSYWLFSMTRTAFKTKEELSIDTHVTNQSVPWNT